jgi:integrase/recombinase XerC
MTPEALEWLPRFRRYLSTERRLSEHTDSNYSRDLAALVAFCDGEGVKVEHWKGLDSQHIRLFAARSHAAGLKPRSIQRRLSAIRSFFDFILRVQDGMLRSGELSAKALLSNPARDVRAPKAPKLLPHTLDPDQMARLLELPPGDELTARDRAIMELFYSSGLRLAELAGLEVTDVDLRDRTVRVLGKGRKMRIVPVGRKAVEALEKWLPERAKIAKPDERAMFVGRNGSRLGHRAIQKRVAYWAQRQGLNVNVHPHLFRHSFATHLLESSRELRGVQELLGHADISTTQIYTHLDFQHLARTYESSHPRARKKA